MPLNRIISRAIEGNAVVTEKVANNSVVTSKILDGTITQDKFTQSALNSISSMRIVNLSGLSGVGYTDVGTQEIITINGSGLQSGLKIFLDDIEISQSSITYYSPGRVDFMAPSLPTQGYHVFIYNPDGGSAVKPLGITYVNTPTWNTFAIPSSTQYNFYNTTLSASSAEGNITYSLYSGALPKGVTLSPKGSIVGYPIDTVGGYIVGIAASVPSGIQRVQYFTLTVNSGTFTANADILCLAGGAGGALGGGGAGGFRIVSNLQLTSAGNISVVVGAGGASTYQNVWNGFNQPQYYGITKGGQGGESSISIAGNLLLRSSGGGGGGAGFGTSCFPDSGGSGGGGGMSATFGYTIGTGASGNLGNYNPPEGNSGGTAGYNTAHVYGSTSFGDPDQKAGGGGGGAGGAGGSATQLAQAPTAGLGGAAIWSTFTGANVAYAGGGGGGGGISSTPGGGAGAGAGSGFSGGGSGSGQDATVNSGSGGGGQKYGYPMTSDNTANGAITVRSGAGGSGIVYIKLQPSFGALTGGNLISTTNGVALYEYKTSNTFVLTSNVSLPSTVTWVTTTPLRLNQQLLASSIFLVYYQLESSLPSGLTLNSRTGIISGVPNANAVPTTFTITAYNIQGVSASKQFTVSVLFDEAPTIIYPSGQTSLSSDGSQYFYVIKGVTASSNFTSNSVVYVNNFSCTTIFQNSATLLVVSPSLGSGSYNLNVQTVNILVQTDNVSVNYTAYASSKNLEVLVIGGGGGGGGYDSSWGGGIGGGGGGGVYTSLTVGLNTVANIFVGGSGLVGGSVTQNFSRAGGTNGGGAGGRSGASGTSGSGGAGAGWSGVQVNGVYYAVAGGGGGGGGGGEGAADNFAGLAGGVQPNGSSGSMTGGAGQDYGSGDGGGAGGGGGGLYGGIGGGVNGPSANGGLNFALGTGAASYTGNGTDSATIPTQISSLFNYVNQSYGNGGAAVASGTGGIVIIRYAGNVQLATGGNISTFSNYTLHTFITSGTFVLTNTN